MFMVWTIAAYIIFKQITSSRNTCKNYVKCGFSWQIAAHLCTHISSKSGRTGKCCRNTRLRFVFPQHLSIFQTSTRVFVTRYNKFTTKFSLSLIQWFELITWRDSVHPQRDTISPQCPSVKDTRMDSTRAWKCSVNKRIIISVFLFFSFSNLTLSLHGFHLKKLKII